MRQGTWFEQPVVVYQREMIMTVTGGDTSGSLNIGFLFMYTVFIGSETVLLNWGSNPLYNRIVDPGRRYPSARVRVFSCVLLLFHF
jgi:hypothetical protein